MKKANTLNIYLPESRTRRKLRAFAFGNRRTLWQERQIHRTDLSRLIQSILFWFLLLFSFRIGTITFFALSGTRNYSGIPVSVPEAKHESWFATDKQTIQVWINRQGLIAVQDRIVNLARLEQVFLAENMNKAASRVFLYVDRRCQMEPVLQVIGLARENGFNEFVFSTQPDTFVKND